MCRLFGLNLTVRTSAILLIPKYMEKKTKLLTFITLAIVALLITLAAWWLWWREPPFPEGLVQANGRIEGDHYTVSGKWPGRVVELLAREGDLIEKGRVMVKLDDAQTQAKVNQAKSAVDVTKICWAIKEFSLDTPTMLTLAFGSISESFTELPKESEIAVSLLTVKVVFSTVI